jgi:hypothetical protein
VDVAVTLLGVALIAFLARDVFFTLLHHEGRGALGPVIERGVWRVARRMARRSTEPLVVAGPLIVTTVLIAWIAIAVLGWALIYWPQLPEGFVITTTADLGPQDGFMDAVYHSLVALTTLGYGDQTPAGSWLRVVAPLQALVGFGLLTASISWVLSIQPALIRMRSLAGDVATLQEAATVPGMPAVEALSTRARWDLLRDFEERLVAVHADLSQTPTALYFEAREPRHSLAHALPVLSQLAEGMRTDPDPELRFAATRLCLVIGRLARTLADDHLHMPDASTDQVLAAFKAERTPSAARADRG